MIPCKDYFAYQFRTPMPIDVSKIDGDMWPSYERCENLSCHAAELRAVTWKRLSASGAWAFQHNLMSLATRKSYQFEVEKMFNCSQISQSESWKGVITCQDNGELLGTILIRKENRMLEKLSMKSIKRQKWNRSRRIYASILVEFYAFRWSK